MHRPAADRWHSSDETSISNVSPVGSRSVHCTKAVYRVKLLLRMGENIAWNMWSLFKKNSKQKLLHLVGHLHRCKFIQLYRNIYCCLYVILYWLFPYPMYYSLFKFTESINSIQFRTQILTGHLITLHGNWLFAPCWRNALNTALLFISVC
jgi:hypothetical protein